MKINEACLEISKKAKDLMEEISKLIPNIKKASYLVFSNKYGQCAISSDFDFILKEFPQAFCPEEKVVLVISLLKEKKQLMKIGESPEVVSNKIKNTLAEITFCENVMVELRFNPGLLNYQLVEEVNKCSLISKTLTRSPLAPVLFGVAQILEEQE